MLGILILIWAMRYIAKERDSYEDFDYEEEVPIFQSRISEDEYKSYEDDIKNEKEELETPFEVVWKK